MKIYKKVKNWYENLCFIKQVLYPSLIIPFLIFLPNSFEILHLVINRAIETSFYEAFNGTYKLCFERCGQFKLNMYIYFKYFYAGYSIIRSFIFGILIMGILNGISSFFKKRKKLKVEKIKV